ncbi:protein-tyrosine phosphatase-like protein [Boletus reticuloceps]|uniref:protein-tyrosine-phosphatase n=1 Tax=Boletus reticuloceps TaxID=495285 RepID=A0A8I2YG33_9AGAM|nr:protein-tyrosine phosphatase-like protein [Boletus reticuloceps]
MWYIQTSQPASSSSPPPPPNGPSPITQTPYPLRPPSASEIIPHFYVSDLAFAENPAALASLGITHVLSAMRGYVALPPLHPPLHCAQFPLDDLPFSELVAHLPHMTAFLHGNHGPERARARTLRRGRQPEYSRHHPRPLRHAWLHYTPHSTALNSRSTISRLANSSPTSRTRQRFCTALMDPNARVLVHCVEGVSRSTSVVAAYLIAVVDDGASSAVRQIKTESCRTEFWGCEAVARVCRVVWAVVRDIRDELNVALAAARCPYTNAPMSIVSPSLRWGM